MRLDKKKREGSVKEELTQSTERATEGSATLEGLLRVI